MNCYQCGSPSLSEQKFCRSCGTSLQIITTPLAEHASLSNLVKTPGIRREKEGQGARNWALWGFMIMFVGVAMGVIGKMLIHDEIVTVVGVLTSLAGMFLIAYPSLAPKYDAHASSQPDAIIPARAGKSLSQARQFEAMPSVTERTTGLLMYPAASKLTPQEGEESQA